MTNPNDSKPCAPKGASVRRWWIKYLSEDDKQVLDFAGRDTDYLRNPLNGYTLAMPVADHDAIVANLQAQVDALTWQRNQMTAAFYAGCLPSRNDLTPHKIKELDAEIEAIARGGEK